MKLTSTIFFLKERKKRLATLTMLGLSLCSCSLWTAHDPIRTMQDSTEVVERVEPKSNRETFWSYCNKNTSMDACLVHIDQSAGRWNFKIEQTGQPEINFSIPQDSIQDVGTPPMKERKFTVFSSDKQIFVSGTISLNSLNKIQSARIYFQDAGDTKKLFAFKPIDPIHTIQKISRGHCLFDDVTHEKCEIDIKATETQIMVTVKSPSQELHSNFQKNESTYAMDDKNKIRILNIGENNTIFKLTEDTLSGNKTLSLTLPNEKNKSVELDFMGNL